MGIPNPRADGFDIDKLCTELQFGPAWASQGHTIDGDKAARSAAGPSKSSNKRGNKPLVRVRVLPFKDTFELNFDHMTQKYVLPYLRSAEVADPETGTGLRTGDEFSANGGRVRFRVV